MLLLGAHARDPPAIPGILI
uniref:Uncharacterized protein n=1 Tax=Rhizophora mucronata TaxID=61149 RepID=A0A2P2NK46_RHIMU